MVRIDMRAPAVLLFVVLILGLVSTASICGFVWASPESWSEVVRFTGAGSLQTRTTPDFTVGHANWRIIWNYTYASENASVAGFVVSTYPRGQSGDMVSFIFSIGGSPTSGIEYVSNQTGTFFMEIVAPAQVTSYSLIVEQDLDSIPEFPSPLVALSLVLVAALLAVTVRRKRTT